MLPYKHQTRQLMSRFQRETSLNVNSSSKGATRVCNAFEILIKYPIFNAGIWAMSIWVRCGLETKEDRIKAAQETLPQENEPS